MRPTQHGTADTGDEHFARFMNQSARRLYRVAYLLTGNRDQAEELTQSALVRTYIAWRRIRSDDAYSYAHRVLVNQHNDWWRGWLRRERPVTQVPDRSSADDAASAVAEQHSVARALQGLTRRERTVIVCRYFLDLTEQQTAAELGIATGTVKSTTARALAKLRIAPELSSNVSLGSGRTEGVS